VLSQTRHWRPARVEDNRDGQLLVHYEGYKHEYDEWIPAHSTRIEGTTTDCCVLKHYYTFYMCPQVLTLTHARAAYRKKKSWFSRQGLRKGRREPPYTSIRYFILLYVYYICVLKYYYICVSSGLSKLLLKARAEKAKAEVAQVLNLLALLVQQYQY
jgi:hypothetical protein